ncbi:alpha-2-macroglobulin family protein [Escherichia coli]|nr:alpha-2-macroglobulin family protein [Escherichia coli]
MKTDKTHYQPGELVNVELTSSLKGKPVSAQLTVGVVDEMIYALQPEIAPNIGKFFYPLGRNNVRTSSSPVVYQLRPGALQRAGCAWRN